MKQAFVIIHGMGEQIPMETLNSFVHSVWASDASLVDPGKPDPDSGGKRDKNAFWAKPDNRNNSTELRRITTETDRTGKKTDFFEYYWAHMMEGTTWEQVSAWIQDLLLRNPRTRVPDRVMHAWIALWAIALAVLAFMIWGVFDDSQTFKVFSAIVGVLASIFVSKVLIKRFGDVARYVKAVPSNVAKRHEIRQCGVDLLDRLVQSKEYDRIVVVAHSLGTIVAYDILSMLYSKYNTVQDTGTMEQPERDRLEQMIREGLSGNALDVEAYQAQQAKAMAEAQEQGAAWNITDFVTLGSPLTHAEFLVAESYEALRNSQKRRILPTCPPTLEYDATTKLHHLSYSNEEDRRPIDQRTPHHAALFAFTRWTNLYSEEKHILTGDLISGPLGAAFGLEKDGKTVVGIRDVAVLPELTPDGQIAKGHKRSFFSHNNYWSLDKGTETNAVEVPHHIAKLREALQILERDS